jgi:predicted nucleic acid-binding protein
MRRHLLDTPLLSALLLNRPFAVQLITPWIENAEVATSILVYGEVNEYIRGRVDYAQLHARLLDLLKGIPPLFITYSIMRRYGELRRDLRRTNSLIGDIDTIITATTLERNLTLVTSDGDFQRVPGLKLMTVPRAQLSRRGR